jgi:hypothetical protein
VAADNGVRQAKLAAERPHLVLEHFLLRGRNFATSPAESQQTLERWVAWFKDLGDQGQLEDPGHLLAVEGRFSVGRRLPPITNLSEK